ncbi:MAG: transglutaminase family protein [Leptolyngbyaceae cyanobacterium CSU_1_4]|nr:transglutaminase family protein [Leptolyngbyaceae cyanobacterium CSU_1_4]
MYQISHITTYAYDRPVILAPHVIRLRPRSDVAQKLGQFSLAVSPRPHGTSELVDLDGNSIIKVWFKEEATTSLSIQALSQVETFRTNPFDYLLEPWAAQLPIDYPASLSRQLQPYLSGQFSGSLDPIATQLAQEVWQFTEGNTLAFLSELNQRIYTTCKYTIRETGMPLPPSLTWSQQIGSCRDVAVLFIEVCRAIGLAARFVSGYQEGDGDSGDRHLHAWAEVYLPGAGWRGYDPTHGLAVAAGHVAIVASAWAQNAAPVEGTLKPGAQTTLHYQLLIQKID